MTELARVLEPVSAKLGDFLALADFIRETLADLERLLEDSRVYPDLRRGAFVLNSQVMSYAGEILALGVDPEQSPMPVEDHEFALSSDDFIDDCDDDELEDE